MFKKILKSILILIPVFLTAQNDTNSPYSIFALGVENKTANGGFTGLGNTGIADNNPYQINNYNSATLGNIRRKSFLFEIGANGSSSIIKSNDEEARISNVNLSHIALAFPIKHNWGIGIGLTPQTKVGYDISSDKTVEGSDETFTTFTSGLGGLNKLYLSSGVKLGKVVSVGFDFSYLFGSIDELTQFYSDVLVNYNKENHYTGINLGGSFQYTFPDKKTSIGATVSLPTKLKGVQTFYTYKTSDLGTPVTIQDEEELDLEDTELPMSFGIGINSEIFKDFTASFDFRKTLWEESAEAIDDEEFKNQSIYGFGVEFDPSVNNLKYWNKLKYRIGFNYNTGFLVLNNEQIDSYFISAGIGLPINTAGTNSLNISYSYGQEGTTTNDLIQENFHRLTLNLSFVGNWFKERKIF